MTFKIGDKVRLIDNSDKTYIIDSMKLTTFDGYIFYDVIFENTNIMGHITESIYSSGGEEYYTDMIKVKE